MGSFTPRGHVPFEKGKSYQVILKDGREAISSWNGECWQVKDGDNLLFSVSDSAELSQRYGKPKLVREVQ